MPPDGRIGHPRRSRHESSGGLGKRQIGGKRKIEREETAGKSKCMWNGAGGNQSRGGRTPPVVGRQQGGRREEPKGADLCSFPVAVLVDRPHHEIGKGPWGVVLPSK